MVYEYANAKLNVLERPFKRTARESVISLFYISLSLRELQVLERETEDKVPVCVRT